MSSIHEIAKHAGVSVASVSRVFNKRPNVREEVKKKVLAAADALGYVPKQSAAKDCYAIVVEHYDILCNGGYGGMLLSALMKEISQREGRVELVTAGDIPLLKAKFFKGVVSTLFHQDAAQTLKDYTRPLVSVNHPVEGRASVCSNEYQGLALAAEHLTSKGHQAIALQTGGGLSYANQKRIEAFEQLITEYDLPVDSEYIKFRRGDGSDWEVTAALMRKSPTAIIATGEEQGPILAYNLAMLGKRVPDDVSVIAYEHCGISQVMNPPQTVIRQNFEELSRCALDMLENESLNEEILVDYALIERESVKKV
jgi:LacI family transcriptional regulator